MSKPTDPKRHPASDACGALMSISEDFHQLLRGSCPRCTTGTGPCGVEVIRQLLAVEDAAPLAVEEPSDSLQLTRH